MKLLLGMLTVLAGPAFAQELKSAAGGDVLSGESPRLGVSGLKPGETGRLDSWRLARFYGKPGDYEGTRVLAHAWAEFRADAAGRIEVDQASPVAGTYNGADPLGLLWSGEKEEFRDLGLKTGRSVLVRLERGGRAVAAAELRFELTDGADRVEMQTVAEKGLHGVFARPKDNAGPLPAIVLLHGSEGGSVEGAREIAVRFAQLGYAAFGLEYFSWAGEEGLPRALVNVPIESITAAREWMARQPRVETKRLSIWGVSKGAELALVAAANLPGIDRVAACVPSSVVWSGFGRDALPGEIYSSWSVQGRSLPYIPYANYGDVLQGKLSAGGEHRLSLDKATAEQRAAARIPIERIQGKVLLLGATRDHVWPSGDMIRAMEAGPHPEGMKALVFEGASHFISGTGEEPQRINVVKNPEGNDPSPDATARATAAAWAATRAFFAR